MILKVKYYDVDSSEPTVMIHDDDCLVIGVQEIGRASCRERVYSYV